MAPKCKREDEGPSNPYAKFAKRGSQEEKERALWHEANLSQFVHAKLSALQAGLPNPDNLLPTGKRRFTKKAMKMEEEWLVEEAKHRRSLLEEH